MKRILNIGPVAGMLLFFLAFAGILSSCKKEEPQAPEEGAEVTAIHITDPASGELQLEQGDEYMIRYEVEPEGLRRPKMTWSIDDEHVAGVKNGKITAMKPGKATITVRSGTAAAEVQLNVKAIHINSFTVPEDVSMIVGERKEIEVSIDPEKANPGCLEWQVENPEMATITIEEGKVYVSALSHGLTQIKVTGGEQTRTIGLQIFKSRYFFSFRLSNTSKMYQITEKMQIPLKDIYSYKPGERTLFFSLRPEKDLDLADFSVKVSNENICSATFIQDEDYKLSVRLILKEGPETGETDICFTYNDKEKNTEFVRNFTIISKSTFDSGSQIYIDQKRPVKNKETFYGDAVGVLGIGINSNIPAKWSSSNPEVIKLYDPDMYDLGSGLYKTVKFGDMSKGTSTITAEDEEGNTLSFQIEVLDKEFPSDVYGQWKGNKRSRIEPGETEYITYPETYDQYILTLESDKESYVAARSWVSDAPDFIEVTDLTKNSCRLDVRKEGYANITATDSKGNEITFKFGVFNSISGLRIAVDFENGYNDGAPDTPSKMRWKDEKTYYDRQIYLLDDNLRWVKRHLKRVSVTDKYGNEVKYNGVSTETARGYLSFEGEPDVWTVVFEDYFGNQVSRRFESDFVWEDGWEMYATYDKKQKKLSRTNENSFPGNVSYFRLHLYYMKDAETRSSVELRNPEAYILDQKGRRVAVTEETDYLNFAAHQSSKLKVEVVDMHGRSIFYKLKF